MTFRSAFLPIVAAVAVGIPTAVLAQTPIQKPVTAQVKFPIDSARLFKPSQYLFATVVTSQDPNLQVGSDFAMQIVDGSLHIAILRSPSGIVRLSSPAATSSGGTVTGDHIQLPAGTLICFNIPGPCGGAPPAPASQPPTFLKPVTPPQSAPPGASGFPFTIDGIGLGMTLDQVRAAAKAAGSVKGPVKQGPVTYNLDTRELGFQLEFNSQGKVRQYNVSMEHPKRGAKDTETSGELHDLLVKSFGPQSTWGKGVIYDIGETGVAYAIVTDPSEL